jgi:hypothetical protein
MRKKLKRVAAADLDLDVNNVTTHALSRSAIKAYPGRYLGSDEQRGNFVSWKRDVHLHVRAQ